MQTKSCSNYCSGRVTQKKLRDFYKTVQDIMNAGASGMAVGRSIFGIQIPQQQH